MHTVFSHYQTKYQISSTFPTFDFAVMYTRFYFMTIKHQSNFGTFGDASSTQLGSQHVFLNIFGYEQKCLNNYTILYDTKTLVGTLTRTVVTAS